MPAAEPQYEWALDAVGNPVSIGQAARGASYVCPVCQGRLIAKKGDVKRHHFAHEQLRFCEPQEVMRLVASLWLTRELNACLDAQREVLIAWPCPICQQSHSVNLLDEITTIEAHYARDELHIDVALLDANGRPRFALYLKRPSPEMLRANAKRRTTTLALEVDGKRLGDLETALAGARIYGGICATQQVAAASGILTDQAGLRQALTSAVSQPPYHLYGPLDNYGGLTHVLTLGGQRLWLPPLLWQRAIGGLRNTINPALQIISQEWPQDDGATIALYYITARDTGAIAVRRFPPGEMPYARLDNSQFRMGRLNATHIARSFAEL